MDKNNFFSLLVIGDDPEIIMEKYNENYEVEPYIKYYFKDKDKLFKDRIKIFEQILKNKEYFSNKQLIDEVRISLSKMRRMNSFEYYKDLTVGYVYDKDGNAITDDNPNLRYSTYSQTLNFISPLYITDEKGNPKEVTTANKGEINWNLLHLNQEKSLIYNNTWELCVDKREAQNDIEKTILNNMKNADRYFNRFNSKKDYILYNASFWTYAILSENIGWVDMDDMADFEWVINFFDNYILPLSNDEKLTIFECRK
jgi:hypothetical protein